jgi:branched-chain amino acid aminotransferase
VSTPTPVIGYRWVEADDRIGYEGRDIHMPTGPEGMGPIAKAMYDTIVGIQTGEIESDWSVVANDAK